MAVNQGLTWLLEMLFPGDPFKLQVHNNTLHHILRRGGRMTTKNTVISCSVMKYAGWCSRELVLYDQTTCLTMTVEGQMLLYFKGKKMAAVTVLLVSFEYTYRWTALFFFLFLQVWLGFWKAFPKDTFLEGFLLLCKASQSLWLLRSKSKTDEYCQICKFFFPVIFIWTVFAKHEQEYCSDDMIPWLILKNSKSAAVWVACLSF